MVPPSVSQLDGAGRREDIGGLFRQAMWLALGLGLVLFAFLTLIPHALGPMGIAPEIVPGATEFLHGIRWGVIALTLSLLAMGFGLFWLVWILVETVRLGFGGIALSTFTEMTPPPQADSANASTTAQPAVARNLFVIVDSAQAVENARLPRRTYGL